MSYKFVVEHARSVQSSKLGTPSSMRLPIATIVMLFAAIICPLASGGVISDNLAETSASDPATGYSRLDWQAQGFTTTSSDYILDSVSLPLAFTFGSDPSNAYVDVFVYDQSGPDNAPGVAVGARLSRFLAADFDYRTFELATATGLSRTLSPNTDYYLVTIMGGFVGSNEGYQWSYTASTSGTGFPSPWTISSDGGASWAAESLTFPNQMRITAIPEPSTYCMALAGLACGGYSMWRRRKRA